MTILEGLTKLTGGMVGLVDLLESVADRLPDLAPTAQGWANALRQTATTENLVALATALPKEIADIAQGKVDPKDHPSDAI